MEVVLAPPVYLGAVIATAIAVWRRDRVQLALAAMATILMVAVALMTEGGFGGNLRYVALPAALFAPRGCGMGGGGARDRARAPAVAIILVLGAIPFAETVVEHLREDRMSIIYESNFYGPNLKAAIAKAGGEE